MFIASIVLGVHLATWHSSPGGERFTETTTECRHNCKHADTKTVTNFTTRLQSSTPGVYLKLDNGLTFGVFKNSFGATSTYAGHSFEKGPFALTVGGITGYRSTIRALIVPSVRIPLGQAAGRIGIMPKVHGSDSSAVHFSLELSR